MQSQCNRKHQDAQILLAPKSMLRLANAEQQFHFPQIVVLCYLALRETCESSFFRKKKLIILNSLFLFELVTFVLLLYSNHFYGLNDNKKAIRI